MASAVLDCALVAGGLGFWLAIILLRDGKWLTALIAGMVLGPYAAFKGHQAITARRACRALAAEDTGDFNDEAPS